MTTTDRELISLQLLATKQARRLLGCYRKGDCEDPEVYMPAIASVLASYPEDVSERVVHPVHGLPGSLKWLPTVAEVKAACDAEMAPRLERAAREQRELRTRGLLAAPAPESEEKRAAAIARWQEMRVPPKERPVGEEEPKETVAEKLAHLKTAPLPLLSDEALAIMGRGKAA